MFRSTTQILSPYVDYSKVPKQLLESGQYRGTVVHDACAKIARCEFPIVPEEFAGYVISYRRWFDLMVDEVIFVEERLIDMDLGFHGQPDLLVKTRDDHYCLADLKTPLAKSKAWRLQIASYVHLTLKHYPYITPKLLKGGSLRLSPDGKAPILDFYEESYLQDFTVFMSLLNCDRYFFG